MINIITLLDNGGDRYTIQDPKRIYLGRMYDNEAEQFQVVFPAFEITNQSSCTLIITNGTTIVDNIPVYNNVPQYVTSNLSQYKNLQFGFSFQKTSGYIKNSEIGGFYFYSAQQPNNFVPVPPVQKEKIDLLLTNGFAGVSWSTTANNTLLFTNVDGVVVDELELSPFVQQQSNLAETDDTNETFVQNKSTIYLANEGEDGTSPYATEQYVLENGGKIDTISVNTVDQPIINKNVDLTIPTQTSNLTNNGDGTSPFATQDYVSINGGKIDVIKQNGINLPITDKSVNVITPTQTSDLVNDGATGTSTYVESSDLSTVATTGNYTDLIGEPTIQNTRTNSQENPYSANYCNNTFAPITFVSNLYANKTGTTTADLIDAQPSVSPSNILTVAGSTNTDYDWTTPDFIFTRTLETITTLSSTNSFTFDLAFMIDRNAIISWGAKVKVSTDGGATWNYISGNQAYGAISYDTGVGNTESLVIFTNALTQTTTYPIGTLLAIEIYKKQTSATSLTTTCYCGVEVDGANIYSFAKFNFGNISIDTNQIADGAVTLPKLETSVQNTLAQVGTIQTQVNTNTSNISTLNTNLSTLSGRVTQNTADISTNQTSINNLQLQINSNDTDILALQSGKVDKTTTIAGVDLQNNITQTEMLGALNVSNGAQVNVLEGVQVAGNALTITNKNVNIPYAQSNTAGVVKTTSTNGVSTDNTTGQLSIVSATNTQILVKTNNLNPLTSSNIDYLFNTVYTPTTLIATSIELADHMKYSYASSITALTITLPATLPSFLSGYLYFTTGATITLISEDTRLKYVGRDCDSSGVFTPQVNTSYEILYELVGTSVSSVVSKILL